MTNLVCQHGQLARSCELCEKDAEIAALRNALQVLMSAPFDYPDDEFQQEALASAMSMANSLLNRRAADAGEK